MFPTFARGTTERLNSSLVQLTILVTLVSQPAMCFPLVQTMIKTVILDGK